MPEQQANRFIKYYGTPTWADLDRKNKRKKLKRVKKVRLLNEDEIAEEEDVTDDSDLDEDADFFQQTGNFLVDSSRVTAANSSLPKTNLDIKVCADANKEEPDKARLKSVEFHPNARVMLTGGLNQKLTLFQVI